MKALSDLLLEQKELQRKIKSLEKKLDKVSQAIAKFGQEDYTEVEAVKIIKTLLKPGDLKYGDLAERAYYNKISGSYLYKIINKYKGKYWHSKKVGGKWVWSLKPSNI